MTLMLPPLPHGTLDPERTLRAPVATGDRVCNEEGCVTLVAYADFECPDCQAFHQAFEEVDDGVRSGVRFVHRHFPMVSSRPRAMQSALALEAAAAQGAFWPMYTALLQARRDRAPGWLDGVAGDLGLDLPRFRDDVVGRTFAHRVLRDLRTGRESGVTGTPGLFLDGVAYAPPPEAGALEADLRTALAHARG